MGKERLDVLLVEKNLVTSRERAKSSIMAGLVYVDGQKVDKAGTLVKDTADIKVTGDSIGYVSRGGLKLAKAIEEFAINLKDQIVADIGASTGGFTDCSLKNGAKKVYAIDVGYGQLAWSLRTDARVINMERTNIRNVTPDDLAEKLNFASIDVAFISLEKVLPAVKDLLLPNGQIVALIKPQFEAGKDKVGKKGVVREPEIHEEVIHKIIDFCNANALLPVNLTYSPVKGPEGNIEYLLHLFLEKPDEACVNETEIAAIVNEAHNRLK
ncbi:TlyA family RNA methyltransferase [Anaerosinus massiliensis]|uniref:TlyA family RNA methyltransferase n=1 Tax=Massilibacillus massiliensis TaxID=1806837 RepID=UPI000DA60F23|nr:TlyA family RNA methyltransferase [Massilibacillus massiliensis]